MTDFVNLPQDPFKRTATTFRPYETEQANKVAKRPTPPNWTDDLGNGHEPRWKGPFAVAALVALAVGVGLAVNSAGSDTEPSEPAPVEVQDGPSSGAIVQAEIDAAVAEAQTRPEPSAGAIVQAEIDTAIAEAERNTSTGQGYLDRAAVEYGDSNVQTQPSAGAIVQAEIDTAIAEAQRNTSTGQGYLDRAAVEYGSTPAPSNTATGQRYL